MSEESNSKQASKKVIGIDLGTVNSCVSVMGDDGKPIVIPDSEGKTTQPSVFAYNSNREPVVGRAALAQAETNRLNTIFAIKRLIGRKFDSDAVREAREKLPYKIVEAPNGDAWVEVDGEPASAEEVSAKVLAHMKEIAENFLGETVNKAVVTVPAHFNDAQRQATKDAGEIAGLKILNMVNEPTAAALAYGLDLLQSSEDDEEETEEKIIAVFDLGGGTFDVTILGLCNGRFEVKSTNGDTYLGGEDFDIALVNHLLGIFRSQEGIDLTQDKAAMQRLKKAAKDAKHTLSDEMSAEVRVENVSSGRPGELPKDVNITINRRELEKIFAQLLRALDAPCIEAMEDAGVSSDGIDEVVLVGGMTRMPLIKKNCERVFGKTPIDDINPDTAVADGAAVQACLIQGMLKGLSLQDVTSLAFGIEIQGGRVVTMLEKNSKLPCQHKTSINVHVVQGEGIYSVENKSLGLFSLSDIPAAARGVPNIEMCFEVDVDGIIHVSASDLDTGQARKIDILPTSGLDREELEKHKKENQQHRKEQARRQKKESKREKKEVSREQELRKQLREGETTAEMAKAISEAQARLKASIFALQFKLDMEGIGYRGESRERLDRIITRARKSLEESDTLAELLTGVVEVGRASREFEEYLELV